MQTLQLHLTIDEVNLLLEALGDLPFARVHTLIGSIQQQAQEQLQESNPPPDEKPPE